MLFFRHSGQHESRSPSLIHRRVPTTSDPLRELTVHIIISGGAGFIGSHLVERLLQQDYSVTAIDNFDPFYDPETKRRNISRYQRDHRFRAIETDVLDLAAPEPQLETGADVFVHLAARPGIPASIRDPVLTSRVNVAGTSAALELARRLGVKSFIFGSSSSVYGAAAPVPFSEQNRVDAPISPYAATKKAGELLCYAHHQIYGLSVVCLRLFSVYGPRQRPDLAIHKFARLMRAGETLPIYGSPERDYTHVEDVLQAFEAAIEYAGEKPGAFEIVNVGAGQPVPLRTVVELLAEALGVEARTRELPRREGDLFRTWADIRKAGHLFGYAPSVPLAEGIRRFAEWFQAENPH